MFDAKSLEIIVLELAEAVGHQRQPGTLLLQSGQGFGQAWKRDAVPGKMGSPWVQPPFLKGSVDRDPSGMRVYIHLVVADKSDGRNVQLFRQLEGQVGRR